MRPDYAAAHRIARPWRISTLAAARTPLAPRSSTLPLPTREAHDDYYARTQKELLGLVCSHPAIEHSWYKNAEGKIHILSPWRLVDYWRWTREPDLGDFTLA